jgi:ATP-dependent helicase YprA (DUF1998 family)
MEITSRVSTDDVAQAKQRLDTVFGRNADLVDVALATNMISVGLDILRLGLMVVQGQPKTAAEYIQATSRIGRDHSRPGLVVVVLNLHKPRDRTHFEQFGNFHRSFYRAVEATSVTPWAARALDRALAAVVVSAGTKHAVSEALRPNLAAQCLGRSKCRSRFVRDQESRRGASIAGGVVPVRLHPASRRRRLRPMASFSSWFTARLLRRTPIGCPRSSNSAKASLSTSTKQPS